MRYPYVALSVTRAVPSMVFELTVAAYCLRFAQLGSFLKRSFASYGRMACIKFLFVTHFAFFLGSQHLHFSAQVSSFGIMQGRFIGFLHYQGWGGSQRAIKGDKEVIRDLPPCVVLPDEAWNLGKDRHWFRNLTYQDLDKRKASTLV